MGITFIAANSSVSAASASINVVRPSGTTTGDLLVAQIFVEDNTDRVNSVPSGWSSVINQTVGARAIRQYVYYKVLSSAEPSTYTWGINATDEIIGMISAYRGADQSAPIGGFAVSTVNAQSSLVTAPALTVHDSSNVVIVAGGNAYGDAWTPPSTSGTFTERVDTRTGTGAANISAFMSDIVFSSTGTSGNQVAVSVNPDYYIASQIEIVAFKENVTLTVSNCYSTQVSEAVFLVAIVIDESVVFKDEDVKFEKADVEFSPGLQTLSVNDAYSACVSDVVTFEYAFLVSHGTHINVAGSVVLLQENILAVANAYSDNAPQTILLSVITGEETEPDPVWFDTETAVFKDHGDGVFYPHYLTFLELSDGVQPNIPESVTLFIEGSFSANSAYHKQVVDSVTLSEEVTGISFPVNNGINSNVADSIILSQHHAISVSNSYSAQVADALNLAIEYILTISAGIQQNVVDTVAFSITGIYDIAVINSAQLQYADATALTQEHVIDVSVTDSAVKNIADVPVLGAGTDTIIVQNSYSSQSVDSVIVSQQHNVSISNTIGIQVADSVVLLQYYDLTASDTYHDQIAESPIFVVESEDTLLVENSVHSQFVDALVLIQSHIAETLDCAQNQYPDTLDLLVHHAISVANCENKNFAQGITLGFRSGFLGVVIDPYLISQTPNRAMESVTKHRYLMQ